MHEIKLKSWSSNHLWLVYNKTQFQILFTDILHELKSLEITSYCSLFGRRTFCESVEMQKYEYGK